MQPTQGYQAFHIRTMDNPKFISRPMATAMAVKYRSLGERVVFTNGCFDVVHAGHIYLLNEAVKLGDILIVGLNDDESIRRLKGSGRPKLPLELRAFTLDGLSSVGYIVPFHEDTPIELIRALKPDVIVKGGVNIGFSRQAIGNCYSL